MLILHPLTAESI